MTDFDPASEPLAQMQARYHALASRSAPASERIDLARRIALRDDGAVAWMNLAFEQFSAYHFGTGHEALQRARAADPDFLPARWAEFQMPPDVAPHRAGDADRFIRRWDEGLAGFESLDYRDPRWRDQVWGCVGQSTAFYRHYLGDAIDEQRRYGVLLQRMMSALSPEIAAAPPVRPRERVVFASAYLRRHTVGRLFAPLIEALDPSRIEVHVLQLEPDGDDLTAALAQRVALHSGPRHAPQWRDLIARLAPDTIVYPDIGMHPLTQGLAALRLAPLQLVMWGHPVTTGLPTIDAVLSPDAMEPDDGATHYSERLWRLPGLGHGLAAPATRPPATDLGRRDNGIELFCAQSVYKLMPEQDKLFARILARLPGARLHLIPHQEVHVRDWLAARLGAALRAAGVDPDGRLVMHPMQSLDGFLGVARGCDLALDSLGWSGGMSSLDLLGAGVPVVTLPGRSMRSRQSAALLQRLDAGECIARDRDDYVEKAVALAADRRRCQRLGDHFFAARHRLHDAAPVVEALQRLLLDGLR
jgi:predicted O-linked N-acetylglucosamine transferase (SPINDLY family)